MRSTCSVHLWYARSRQKGGVLVVLPVLPVYEVGHVTYRLYICQDETTSRLYWPSRKAKFFQPWQPEKPDGAEQT